MTEIKKLSKIIIGNAYVASILSGMTRRRITCIVRCLDKNISDNDNIILPGFKYIDISDTNDINEITSKKDMIKNTFDSLKQVYNGMIYSDNDAKTHILLSMILMIVFDMTLKNILTILSSLDDTYYYGASKYVFTDDDMNRLKKIEIDVRGVSSIEIVKNDVKDTVRDIIKTDQKKKIHRQNKIDIKNVKRKHDYKLIMEHMNKNGKIINNDLLCDMLNSNMNNDDILYAFLHDA